MYLTYDEYMNMGGTLSDASFLQCEIEAESRINYMTFNRLVDDDTVDYKVKECVYLLIDLISSHNSILTSNTEDKTITSQSNDGVSVAYNVLSAKEYSTQLKEQIELYIRLMLGGVRNKEGRLVLYKGVYCDE